MRDPDTHASSEQDVATLAGDAATGAARPIPASVLQPGTAVGRYIVLERVGLGSYGVVYSAYDPQLDRRVALKLLRRVDDDANTQLLEARALARLSHPNVVTIHDVGELDGAVFLAMEFIAGRTLHEAASASEADRLRALIDAGRGLHAAHQLGIVHGDFKPANVMIGADGRARVLDFGLATGTADARRDGERAPTVAARVAGTPAYMAPELFAGAPTTVASDVFAYCVALYELLAGTRPFAGDNAIALARAITQDAPPPLPRRVPARVRRVVLAGLSRTPGDRPAGVAEVVAALQSRRGRTGLAAAAATAVTAVAVWRASVGAPVDPCVDATAALAGLLDEGGRERLRQHFAQPGEPELVLIAPRVEQRLDDALQQTRTELGEVCALEHRPPAQRPARLVERRRCLEVRSAVLGSVIDQLEQANPSHLGLAPAFVEIALRETECDARGASDRLLASAQSDAEAVRIGSAMIEVAWAHAEIFAGYFDEGQQRIGAALQTYADLERVQPRLELLDTRYLHGVDDIDRAAERARETTWHALRIGEDEAAVRGLLAMIWIESDRGPTGGAEGGGAVADVLLSLAQAMAEGMPDARSLQIELATTRANLHTLDHDLDGSLVALRSAEAQLDPMQAIDAREVAETRALQRFSERDYLASWRAAAEAGALRRFLYGAAHPLATLPDRVTAAAMVRAGETARGRALLEHSVAELRRHFGGSSRPVLLATMNLCSLRRDSDDLAGATACYAEVARVSSQQRGLRAVLIARRGLASSWVLAGEDLAASLLFQLVLIAEHDLERRLITTADLADLWRRHGLGQLARAQLEQTLAATPTATLAHRHYAEIVLVDVLLGLDDDDGAQAIVDAALTRPDSPYSPSFVARRGILRARRGDDAGAREDLAVALAAIDFSNLSSIGWSGIVGDAMARVLARLDPADPAARQLAERTRDAYRRAPGYAAEAAALQRLIDGLPPARPVAPGPAH
ncbi:MAG: serine/threonine protein kinase [Nannocystaceae bacterium]|nr:serine/threonine protein kinase [Nannocystaceae bacterium]